MERRDFVFGALALATTGARNPASPIPAIARYEAMSGGHIGFFAEDAGTGKTMSWRADERFVMCSTFKASLAAVILQRVDRRRDDLEQRIHYGTADISDMYAPVAIENVGRGYLTVREMCKAAVEQSDNTCANLLLDRIGGPLALTGFWRALGDRTSRLDDPEPFLNRTPLGGVKNTTTPRAMARTLGKLTLERDEFRWKRILS